MSIMVNNKMKAFIISLSKISSSAESSQQVLENLLKYGLDAELFEGTYGYNAQELFDADNRRVAQYGIKTKNISKEDYLLMYPEFEFPNSVVEIVVRAELGDAGKILRPGVVGCFYSHYRLWQKCLELNEPILIFEDDVLFERNYIPVEWDEVMLLCTGKEAHKHDFYAEKLYNPVDEPGVVKLHNTSMPGAVGYGITPKGAKKLVEYYQEEFLPADTAMNVFVVKLECHTHLMGRAAAGDDGKVSLTASKFWNEPQQ